MHKIASSSFEAKTNLTKGRFRLLSRNNQDLLYPSYQRHVPAAPLRPASTIGPATFMIYNRPPRNPQIITLTTLFADYLVPTQLNINHQTNR